MNPIQRKSARVALLSTLALAAAFTAQAKSPAPDSEAASAEAKPAAGGKAADSRELRDSSVQPSAPADLRKGVAPADLRKATPGTEVRDNRNP